MSKREYKYLKNKKRPPFVKNVIPQLIRTAGKNIDIDFIMDIFS